MRWSARENWKPFWRRPEWLQRRPSNSPFSILQFAPEGDARAAQGRFSRETWDGAIADLPNYLYDEATPRVLATPRHTAYIKIAEGCDHPCSFCIIPQLRGKFRSRRFESVIAEAERLAQSGVREITLIGQDTTCYGEDFGLKDGLALLLEKLARNRRAALGSFSVRLSQQDHRAPAGHHRGSRQDLLLHRRSAAARIAGRSETHEARRQEPISSCARLRKCGAPFPGSRCAPRSSSGFPAKPNRNLKNFASSCATPSSTGWARLAIPIRKALAPSPRKEAARARNRTPAQTRYADPAQDQQAEEEGSDRPGI